VITPGSDQRSWDGRDGRPEVGREGGWGGGRGHAGGSGGVVPPRQTQPRILLAKPGLDGHDRGIKVIAFALREAGAEVVYLGLRQSAAAIVAAAVAEDADLIGISVLSGAHLPLAKQIVAERAARDAGDIPVAIGGTIPADHADLLREMGVDAVYPVGSPLPDVVAGLLALAGQRDSPADRQRAS
jgi:methylmalonyl-CoA mutase, C-terminal domain